MKHKDDAFVVHLANNPYKFLVLEVDNKDEVIEEIKSHIPKV